MQVFLKVPMQIYSDQRYWKNSKKIFFVRSSEIISINPMSNSCREAQIKKTQYVLWPHFRNSKRPGFGLSTLSSVLKIYQKHIIMLSILHKVFYFIDINVK